MAQHVMTGRRSGTGSAVARMLGKQRNWWFDGPSRTWIMLILAALLPLLLSGGWVTSYYAQKTRNSARRDATDTVERAANRISAELTSQLQVAQALTTSSALDSGDLQTFRAEAVRLLALQPLWHTIELTSPSGVQLLNLLRPEGRKLGPTADLVTFHQVLATRQPAIGGIGPIGPVSGLRLVTLRVPVIRAGTLLYILTFAMVPDSVGSILKTSGAPRNWVGVVVDSTGHVIARTANEHPQVAAMAGEALRVAMARSPSGRYESLTPDGVLVETVFRALPAPAAWTVAFGIPSSILDAPVRRALYVLGGVGGTGLALTALLTSLVAFDLTQRRRDERDRATKALTASEQRQALALDAAELGTWRWGVVSDQFDGSTRCLDLLGLSSAASEAMAPSWQDAMAHVHPDDRIALTRAIRNCRDAHRPLQHEFRLTDRDHRQRWLRMDGRVQEDERGLRSSVQGVIADITLRRQAEADHLALLRRLGQAQEDERRRISRELHDQVGQTVTGLSLGLKAMDASLPSGEDSAAAHERLQWLQSLTDDIGRDIHQMASDLRPTALDDFGLFRAIETFAGRWRDRYQIEVDVQTIGDIGRLSPEIETVVYRIVQEALTNVLKHAEARHVSVVMERTEKQFQLIVEDDGRGFDPALVDEGVPSLRLGLSGIRERLSLVGGSLVIESSDGAGATLFVYPPGLPWPGNVMGLRVLLADDHPVVIAGIRTLLLATPDLEVIGEAHTGQETLTLIGQMRPDIAVVDISMPGLNGVELAQAVPLLDPRVKLLALTVHEDRAYVQRMLQAGVRGYLLKRTAAEELVRAIRAIHAGGLYLDPAIASKAVPDTPHFVASISSSTTLSAREEHVLRLTATGLSNKEISAQLDLSIKTVETYKARATEKLALRTRADIVRYGIKEGWFKDSN